MQFYKKKSYFKLYQNKKVGNNLKLINLNIIYDYLKHSYIVKAANANSDFEEYFQSNRVVFKNKNQLLQQLSFCYKTEIYNQDLTHQATFYNDIENKYILEKSKKGWIVTYTKKYFNTLKLPNAAREYKEWCNQNNKFPIYLTYFMNLNNYEYFNIKYSDWRYQKLINTNNMKTRKLAIKQLEIYTQLYVNEQAKELDLYIKNNKEYNNKS